MFNQNKEIKMALAAEQRQQSLAQEQLDLKIGATPDLVEIQQHEQRTDLLKWQQDFELELIILKYRLRRQVKDKEGNWGPSQRVKGRDPVSEKLIMIDIPPYLNELGITMIEDQIWPLVSRNLINSNLSEERILKILENTSNAIADNLADHYDSYDVEFTNFGVIIRLCKNTIIAAPFRAMDGWNKKMDATMNKRIEAYHENAGQNERKKLFGIF